MTRITLTVVCVLLAVPALGWAKGGLEFAKDTETVGLGHPIEFTALLLESHHAGQALKEIPGVRLSHPASTPAAAQPRSAGGFPWVWVLSGASVLAAVAVAGARAGFPARRLRTLLGGSA